MGVGAVLIKYFGMKSRYQKLFEKFLKLGVMGLGYEQPMKSSNLEELLIKRVLKNVDNPLIFDVGANKGQYISLVQKTLKTAFKIHAFEPDTENAKKIDEQFSDENIKIISLGLSSEKGTLQFFNHEQDDLSSIYTYASNYRDKRVKRVSQIDLTTIDEYCMENSIEVIDFLKIDTEGHDYFVLKGAKKMIDECRVRNIQFEFSEMNLASKTTFFDF